MSLPETYKVLLPAHTEGGQPFFEDHLLPKLTDNQVLIKVEFAPIHPSDIFLLQGYYKIPGHPVKPCGYEGSGTIVAVGNNLKVSHKIGDKVFLLGPGTYSQYVVRNSEEVQIVPEDLSLEEAASHFMNPATVYYMGTLAEGHKAAIHTVGASAVGRMLIRYFKYKGIKLINIVRKEEQIEELKAAGADYVLNSQAEDFEQKLKELAEQESATIAFDAINGEFTGKVLRAQPVKSIIYVYGSMAGFSANGVGTMELFQGKVVAGFLIFNYLEELKQKGESGQFFENVHALLKKVLYSKVQKTFKAEELDEAIAYSAANSSKGKIMLRPN